MPHKEKSIVDDARTASKAVVRLHVRGFSESDPRAILDPRFVVPEEWTGSGFFIKIKGEDGYILTNSHVARNSRTLEIKSIVTSDELFKVEVIGFVDNLEPDIALLKFSKGEKERFLSLSSEKSIPSLLPAYEMEVKRGEEVKTIGYPLGMSEPNVSGGEISNFIAGTEDSAERMVTDAAINPGNSGGPAVIRGPKVVGINTAIIMGADNIGFITPIHLINNLFDLFLQKKPVGLFKLGASLQKNSALNAKMLGIKKNEGVIVTKIFKDSPAEAMGLQIFDVILQVNNQRLDRHGNVIGEQSIRKRNFHDLIHKIFLGDEFYLKICRSGKVMDLKGHAFLWQNNYLKSRPVISKRRYFYFHGLILQEVSTEIVDSLESIGLERDEMLREFYLSKSKIIVTHIVAGSPAEETGLGLGDFLVAIQGQKVRTLKNLILIVKHIIQSNTVTAAVQFASGSIAHFNMQIQPQNDLFIHHSDSEGLYGI